MESQRLSTTNTAYWTMKFPILIRVIVAAYHSDFFPVLLLLTGYMLFAFAAALILLLWLIAHPA